MRSIRAKNIVVIVAVMAVATVAGMLVFRPDLVPYASFQKGIETIMNSLPGQNGGDVPFGSKSKKVTQNDGGDQVPVKKDVYLIELKSGGRVYTDNLKTGDGKLSYQTDKGLIVEINSYEVIGVHTLKEGHEPDR